MHAAVAVMDESVEVGAEGVETEDDLRRLRELGADIAQGYLIATPQPSEKAIEEILARLSV